MQILDQCCFWFVHCPRRWTSVKPDCISAEPNQIPKRTNKQCNGRQQTFLHFSADSTRSEQGICQRNILFTVRKFKKILLNSIFKNIYQQTTLFILCTSRCASNSLLEWCKHRNTVYSVFRPRCILPAGATGHGIWNTPPFNKHHTHRANVGLKLVIVYDAGPTVKKHWFNVSRLPGLSWPFTWVNTCTIWYSYYLRLGSRFCCFLAGHSLQNVGLLLNIISSELIGLYDSTLPFQYGLGSYATFVTFCDPHGASWARRTSWLHHMAHPGPGEHHAAPQGATWARRNSWGHHMAHPGPREPYAATTRRILGQENLMRPPQGACWARRTSWGHHMAHPGPGEPHEATMAHPG